MYKKGVSPLIATVLLVMIVVSIGAAVMLVIQGIATDNIEAAEEQAVILKCGPDIKLNVVKASGRDRICINAPPSDTEAGNFTLFLENAGKAVTGWKVTVIGNRNVFTTTSQGGALAKGAIQGFRFTFNGTGKGLENVSQIRLSPQIPGPQSSPIITCEPTNLDWDNEKIQLFDSCGSVVWDDSV